MKRPSGTYVVGPTPLFVPRQGNGQPNQFFELVTQAATRGLRTHDNDDGTSEVCGIGNYSMLTWATVKSILSVGGEVYDYPAFMKISSSRKRSDIPSFVPGYQSVDQDGNVTRHTWDSWTRDPMVYRDGNDNPTGDICYECFSQNKLWPASVLKQLDDISGIDIIAPPGKPDLGGKPPTI